MNDTATNAGRAKRPDKAPRPISLALQGGGSHGALTWGVLDRLLEDDRLEIRAISGTSAGAMNAVALASGYRTGGRQGARDRLREFWRAVSRSTRFSPIQRGPLDRMRGEFSLDRSPGYLFFESLSRVFSPYQLNPGGMNPLRDLLAEQVDFADVNATDDLAVYVAATNVRTGQPKVFGPGDLTIDSVLASACLPQMQAGVEIDGEEYWDGGFTGNPALYPLLARDGAADIVVVQINPFRREALPRSAREIINRVNEISFNSSLVKELRTIAYLQRVAADRNIDLGRYSGAYLHLIHVDTEVEDLAASSKMNAEWTYLEFLFGRGRSWADDWLRDNFDSIGVSTTLDLEGMFGAGHLPDPEPA